mgnify:CR=1 FL=1
MSNNVNDEELKIDETKLSDEEKKEMGYHFPWWILIICGAILLIMIGLMIAIFNM